jgi:hypothetical protein
LVCHDLAALSHIGHQIPTKLLFHEPDPKSQPRPQCPQHPQRPINKLASDMLRCLSHDLTYLEPAEAEVRGDALLVAEQHLVIPGACLTVDWDCLLKLLAARLEAEDKINSLILQDRIAPRVHHDSPEDPLVNLFDFRAGEDTDLHFKRHFPGISTKHATATVAFWLFTTEEAKFTFLEAMGQFVVVVFPNFATLRDVILERPEIHVNWKKDPVMCRIVTAEDIKPLLVQDDEDRTQEAQLMIQRWLRLGGTYWTISFTDRGDKTPVHYIGGMTSDPLGRNQAKFAALVECDRLVRPKINAVES